MTPATQLPLPSTVAPAFRVHRVMMMMSPEEELDLGIVFWKT